jgi:hypothetical protein
MAHATPARDSTGTPIPIVLHPQPAFAALDASEGPNAAQGSMDAATIADTAAAAFGATDASLASSPRTDDGAHLDAGAPEPGSDAVMQFGPDEVGADVDAHASRSHHGPRRHRGAATSASHHHGPSDTNPTPSVHVAPPSGTLHPTVPAANGSHAPPHGGTRPANGAPILRVD